MTNPATPCDSEALWAMAVGTLESDEEAAQESHLAGCPHCQVLFGEIRADVEALGYQREAAASAEAQAAAILARTREVRARGRLLRWGVVCALFLGALAFGLAAAHRLTEKALNRQELWRVEHAIQRLQNARGAYPTDEDALAAALRELADPELRLDERGLPLDRWDRPFRYRFPGRRNPGLFDLWSVGPDGIDQDGGPDDQTNGPR